jgi:hypothetical protein
MGLPSTKTASTITIYRAFSPQRSTASQAASIIAPYHIEERQQLCEKKDLYSEYDTECNILKNDCGGEEDELHQNDVVYMGNGLSIQYVDKADGMNSSFLPWRLSR